MIRRILLLALVVMCASTAVAAAQLGGPELPPTPDAPKTPTHSSTPSRPSTPSTPRSSGSSGSSGSSSSSSSSSSGSSGTQSSTPTQTGPTAAQIAAQQQRAAAARRAAARARLIKQRELNQRLASVRGDTVTAIAGVSAEVPGLVKSIPLPLPPKPPSQSTRAGGGSVMMPILGLFAVLIAMGSAAWAYLRRSGGRRWTPRDIGGGVVTLDRRHMGVAIAAMFVVGAALAAAVLAYLIVNPTAVG
ncbi:MAG: hypothetical protein U0Y82_00205 [Thermoleophilia bacterium]